MGWEVHHKRKKDSPSGTALTLARIVTAKSARKTKVVTERLDRAPAPDELHFASVRGGDEPGTHTLAAGLFLRHDRAHPPGAKPRRVRPRRGPRGGVAGGAKGTFRSQRFHPGDPGGGTRRMKLEGVYTALVTPMTADGAAGREGAAAAGGLPDRGRRAAAWCPVGTTGESPTLDGDECKRVIQIVVEQARGRVPVIAGAGSNSTAEAIHYAKDAQGGRRRRHPPGGPVLQQADQPGIPRAFPRHRGRGGPSAGRVQHRRAARGRTSTTPRCWSWRSTGTSSAVKEASGDIGQIMDLIARKPAEFTVLSGDDNLVFPIMALGGTGVISVASNLLPAEMSRLVGAALKGDWNTAQEAALRAAAAVQGDLHRDEPHPHQGGPGHEGNDHGNLPAADVLPGSEEPGVPAGHAQGAEDPVRRRASRAKPGGQLHEHRPAEAARPVNPRSTPSCSSACRRRRRPSRCCGWSFCGRRTGARATADSAASSAPAGAPAAAASSPRWRKRRPAPGRSFPAGGLPCRSR